MNTSLNPSATCYGLFENNEMIAFCSIIHFPHPRAKNIKREHRLVVLPDYQGIGIGSMFSNVIAKMYKEKGYRFIATTSAKNLIKKRMKDCHWKCIRYGKTKESSDKSTIKKLRGTHRTTVNTASFEYVL